MIISKVSLVSKNPKLFFLFFSLFLISAFFIIWYFQKSFLQFFLPSPKTHSIIQFDSRLAQKVNNGDLLTGKGIPASKVGIYMGKDNEIEQKTDASGKWLFQIPSGLEEGVYRFTVVVLDKAEQITSVKGYKLDIDSSSLLERIFKYFNAKKLVQIKPVKAQENSLFPQFVQSEWAEKMISLGVYPVVENGETVLYSRESLLEVYNSGRTIDFVTCRRGCLTTPEPIWKIIAENRSDNILLTRLLLKLYENGYSPVKSLEPYFPEIGGLIKEKQVQVVFPLAKKPITKEEIDENTLVRYIYEVVQENRWRQYYWSRPDEMARVFIEKTDPIFGVNSLIKWLTLKPNQLSDEERLNALFGLTLIYGLTEKGIGITSKAVLDFPQMIKDAGAIRRSIQAHEIVPFSVVEARAAGGWVPVSRWSNFLESSLNATKTRNLLPQLSQALPYESGYLQQFIYPLIYSKKAFVLNPDITRPLLEEQISRLSHLMQSKLKGKVSDSDLRQVLNQNWVIVVEDSAHELLLSNAIAFAHGRLMVMRGSVLGELGQNSFRHTFFHENIHIINSIYRKTPHIGKYFRYKQEQADNYGRLMSIFYEVATDDIVRVYFGLEGNYQSLYPKLTASFRDLIQRLINKSGGGVSWADFAEFALTGDDGVLLSKILSYRSPTKITPEEFVRIVKEEVDIQKLNMILQDVAWVKQKEAFEHSQKTLKIGAAGGGAVILSAYFAAAVKGEELPPDTTIIYPPLEFSEDLNILKDQSQGVYTITIESINGSLLRGGTIQPSAFISQNGINVDTLGLTATWKITTEGSSDVLTSCQNKCQIKLPADLRSGKYSLVVNLTKEGSDQILASDSYPITIEDSKAPSVVSVVINEEHALAEDNIASFKLPGTEGQEQNFVIPVMINYSDDSRKYLTLAFNYRPMQEIISPATSNCPEPYPQCGGTAGLEDYPKTDTILVKPVCDNQGNIINYEKENLRNRGECYKEEPQKEQKCDDQYYFDTKYDTCVHKYSGDSYPNCNYIFDPVERSFCP